jgi:hypothetical protein
MGVLKIRSGGVWVPVAQGVGIASPGYVGYAQAPSNDQSVGSNVTVDITGVSVTFNAIAGHTYKTTLFACVQSGASGAGVYHVNICDASNTVKHSAMIGMPASDTRAASHSLVESNLSGSTTRKGQFAMLFGGGTASAIIVNSSARNAYILVEDITTATMDGLATSWTAVTFENSWANIGGPEQTCQYRKVGDRVELRGVMSRNPVSYGAAAFTLPVGFRPPATVRFNPAVMNAAGTATLSRGDINSGGAYAPASGPSDATRWDISMSFSTVA